MKNRVKEKMVWFKRDTGAPISVEEGKELAALAPPLEMHFAGYRKIISCPNLLNINAINSIAKNCRLNGSPKSSERHCMFIRRAR